jgi:hypothetical protein
VAEKSRFTAVHQCLWYQRTTVLERLEELGVSYPDNGLHLAALYALPGVCRTLLGSGHNAQTRNESSLRTPLAELCFGGAYRNGIDFNDWTRRVRETMELLVPLTDMTMRFDLKYTLHLALDNKNLGSTSIVYALLTSWNHQQMPNKNEAYLIEDRNGLNYSPTKYVEYYCRSKPSKDKNYLIEILRNHGFSDRYFATKSLTQPVGAVGLPPAIEAAVNTQQKAQSQHDWAVYEETMSEWKHTRELERQVEVEEARMTLNERWHKQEMRQGREKANLFINTLDKAARRGLIERPLDLGKVMKQLQENAFNNGRAVHERANGDSGRIEELDDDDGPIRGHSRYR